MPLPEATAATLHALRRGDLSGARALRLPGGLAEFPAEILALADTLEVLDLSGGTLSELPADFGRLRRLRVLFCSGNRFTQLPAVLGDCEALSQVGFRGTGLREVPGEALPPSLRWLTLTDNLIEHLPEALGERPLLQKLMLSGNRLRMVPESLAGAHNLELIRLSANALQVLPPWLTTLPRLAWASWAGNPAEPRSDPMAAASVPWSDLALGALLGEGASGRVHAASWRDEGGAELAGALKLFKGAMTSDGLPEREMAAALAAGAHSGLTGAHARIVGHPEGACGLLMARMPESWRALAGPPSLASCSRDVYDPALRLAPEAARRLVRTVGAAAHHLHGRGLLHGDLYAHNVLWDGRAGDAVLSDFGAACILPAGAFGADLQRVEVRAWGLLLREVLALCPHAMPDLDALARACTQPDVRARPTLAEALATLPA